jgi:hypothetical protein
LDGVGLGEDDPAINPLAAGDFPTLDRLLDGRRAAYVTAPGSGGHPAPLSTPRAELAPADAHLGVDGRPQSATGQAAILTGINVAQRLGEHFGPRPDARVRAVVDEGNLFRRVGELGGSFLFCNAYPDGYFEAVQRGKRLLSVIPYAATSAGQPLLNHADLRAGRALAADFTGAGWRSQLGYEDVPVYAPAEAGCRLWMLAQPHQLVFFEHWQTDLLGHRGDLPEAVKDLQVFDAFLGGLLNAAGLDETLIIVASDHGNVEDCSHGKHTDNPALCLVIGAERQAVAQRIFSLIDLAPAILDFLNGKDLKTEV